MIPVLFSPTAAAFDTFGLGALTEAISPHVVEEINGIYTLELQYPLSGQHFAQIRRRSVILAKPNPQDDPQPFRVKRITRPVNGIVSIYAEHLSYDLDGIPVLPFSAATAGEALSKLQANAVTANPFTLVSESVQTLATMTVTKPSSARGLMGGSSGSILEIYGGEYAYDVWRVTLKERRGADNGVVIRYGVDLVDLTQEENIASMYTGVLPYYQQQDTTVTGSIQSAGSFDFSRVLPLDVSGMFDDVPTVAQVNAAGRDYIEANRIGVPLVSLSLRFAQLPQLEAIRGAVALGDTIGVDFSLLGVDATARIIKTDYDVLAEKYISVEVGDPRPSIADTIATISQDVSGFASSPALLAVIEAATAIILGAKGGSVRLLDNDRDGEPDTLYIADDPDPARATKVWRFNYEGWGASVNGYNGPFQLGATFQDGGTFFANVLKVLNIDAANISTGTLNADRIGANSIAVSKLTGRIANSGWELDLEAGTFTIGEISADKINGGTINAENINVTNINGANIKNGTVGSDPLASGAVTSGKIGSGAVTSGKIGSGAVTTGKIQNGAVTGGSSGKIAGSTITTSNTVSGINTSLANADNYKAATVQNATGPGYFNCGTIRARQGQFVDGANGITFTAKFSSTLGGWYLGSGGEG